MFNTNLKRIRLENNLTQKEVADFLHISPQSISKWESGEATPSIEFLPNLAILFKCSIDNFFEEKNAVSKVKDVEKFLAFLQYFEAEKPPEEKSPLEFMAENCGWQDNCKLFYDVLAKEKFVTLSTLQSIVECNSEEIKAFALLLEANGVITKVPESKMYVVNQDAVSCSFSMIKASRAFEALGHGKSIQEAIEAIH